VKDSQLILRVIINWIFRLRIQLLNKIIKHFNRIYKILYKHKMAKIKFNKKNYIQVQNSIHKTKK